jgi:hypothetical protein
MGPRLNLETSEEIDAPIETQNPNAPEEPTKRGNIVKHILMFRNISKVENKRG